MIWGSFGDDLGIIWRSFRYHLGEIWDLFKSDSGQGVWGAKPPGKQGGLGGRWPPNSIPRHTQNQHLGQANILAGCSNHVDVGAPTKQSVFYENEP